MSTEPPDAGSASQSGSDPQRIAVLLGAGASRGAGLPLTHELTEQVITRLAKAEPKLSPVLNYVCSAIIGHAGTSGQNPLNSLNIERVVSSIRLLAERGNHEAAPLRLPWRHIFDVKGSASSVAVLDYISSNLAGEIT
jgi:hypothetical protein